MNNTKRLWDFDNYNLFEIDIFHHTKEYASWNEFISDENALSCNCISSNPLLYWYWIPNMSNEQIKILLSNKSNKSNIDNNECDWNEVFDAIAKSDREKYFGIIHFVFRKWFNEMGMIVITVNSLDEPAVRKFIGDYQMNQVVN